MTEILAISVDKKNTYPKSDGQKEKVYELDNKLGYLVKNVRKSKGKPIDFISLALEVFEKEGFNNMDCFDNKAKRTSQVNIFKQKLSFSSGVIADNDFEVLIHELTHAVCIYHYGYRYSDSHSEIFVSFLFSLLHQYCGLSQIEMESLADEANVKYFYNLDAKKEILSKKEYEIKKSNIEKCDKHVFIEENTSLHKSFKSFSFARNDNKMIVFFENNNGFYLYTERNLLQFEKDLHLNPFLNKNKKELVNLKIISPLFKMNVNGKISSHGRYHSFGFTDFSKALDSNKNDNAYQFKEVAQQERRDSINRYKRGGNHLIVVKSVEQYFALREHYMNALKK